MHKFCLEILVDIKYVYNDHECDLVAQEVLYRIILFTNVLEFLRWSNYL